jgi:plasmid stability protein
MFELIIELDDDILERLRARATRNGRSLEAEVRVILEDAVRSEIVPDRNSRVDPTEREKAIFRAIDATWSSRRRWR